MFQLTPKSKILLGIKPLDFRKGIDGISKVIKSDFELDPMESTILVFINRRGTQVRLLSYDRISFWLFMKRLSKGIF
ncbi:MAG: IS66 family insertion sequence element accessory protein TnpB [Pseudobacteriovorax sp.]|nr:IS66 family insertion sequence element accessory protein TnpB [Pseudobacteriovorax sp.]